VRRVVFVAGLTPMASGHGGQLTAATALFESDLARQFTLVPISSTMVSIPPPGLPVRMRRAARRFAAFARELPRADAALIFSADGLALMEKGLMCVAARIAGRGVVVRLSSGHLVRQVNESALLARWLRVTLRCAHVVCSQGRFWTEFFAQYPEAQGKVVEIGNGIPLPARPAERSGALTRLVFAGAIDRTKGVFELVEAFRRVRAAHPAVKLTLAGGGRDLEALRSRVKADQLEADVSFLGWVPHDEIPPLLGSHDAFVFPSHHEGLPNAVLEAMAAALPVISTRVGSIPDAVTDRRDGLLVEPKDVDALTAAVASLLANPERARAMGQEARVTVERRYDIRNVCRSYVDVIERAIAESRRVKDARS